MIRSFIAIASFFASVKAAHAEPITLIVTAVSTIFTTIGAGVTAAGVAVFGATAWGAIGAFLASPIGTLLLGVGLSLVSTLFQPKQKKSQNAPTIEAGKINVRITEPERWLCAGRVRQGGGAIFGEFSDDGAFWYVVIHSDSILANIETNFLDDQEVLVDLNNFVQTDDFCLDGEYNSYSGSGTKQIFFHFWTHTYSEGNPVPPANSSLAAAFPGLWTSDHKLVGTTYSVIRIGAIPIEHRAKVYKWRGVFGLGDPAGSIVGMWSHMYDPRDNTQNINDKSTWKTTSNPVLIWAWFRTHRYGRGKSMDSINWNMVSEQADICDQNVVGVYGTQKRYECGIAIPESKERSAAEQEILISCDGQLVFDNDGKCWVKVGYYEAATLTLTRNRDIVGMESVEAQNGESESQGVIVRYIDPDARYSTQPSAAWLNPLYYDPAETPKFLQVDVLACQNHNQAMRLAKAIGMRSQAEYKLLPTVGLRGLKARQERIINLQYDNVFSGEHEIVTTVEVDETGVFCGFGAVPVDVNRWTLLPGEERPKAVIAETTSSNILILPTGVSIAYNNNRIEAYFDPAPRSDWRYKFQYRTGSDEWTDMVTVMENNFSYSGVIAANAEYSVRYQTVSGSGKVTAWSSTVTINTSPLTLSGTPVTVATEGNPYTSWTLGVSGGVSPYAFTGSGLPPGITIDPSTGLVSGTPSTGGVGGIYPNISLRASDAIGNYKDFPQFTIEVFP